MSRLLYTTAALALLSGCSGGVTDIDAPLRRAIVGEVTLDGRPLSQARILLEPSANAGVNTQASAEVVDGRFSIPVERGPAAGEYRVLFEPVMIEDVEAVAQAQRGTRPKLDRVDIPKRYTTPPGLPAVVSLDGPNALKFELVSKPQ
jgi:hypothetical protein